MPLFSNQPNQSTAIWEPKAADGRLAQTAGANEAGVFTSDLSVSEYVLLGEAGFEPLGFVVGSSIYHVGLQASRWGQNLELQVLTQAMYNARELAMARMRAEAECGASTRPSSWPPAPPSAGSPRSTGCRIPPPGRRSPSAWTSNRSQQLEAVVAMTAPRLVLRRRAVVPPIAEDCGGSGLGGYFGALQYP